MKKLNIVLLIMLILFTYNYFNLKSKGNKIRSEIINKDYVVTYYQVYNFGVWGGDIGNVYLSNSKNKEIFIGTFDDDTYYDFSFHENFIEVTKLRKKFKRKIIIYKRKLNKSIENENNIFTEFYYTVII